MLDSATTTRLMHLASWMAQRATRVRCPVFGISGGQGSGKSTAAAFLRDALQMTHGLRAAVVSLDDFYLSRVQRRQLAAAVHPLFATRGVPGTHDAAGGLAAVTALRTLEAGSQLVLPRFSKAHDDPLPLAEGCRVAGPLDMILFEGWCVGLPPQDAADLVGPVNALEAQEDQDGRWRTTVNQFLAGAYSRWFAMLDARIFLQVPDLASVRRWRAQQERETAAASSGVGAALMSDAQLDRFIQHYQRLSQHALQVMPACADVLLTLGDDHGVREMLIR